MPQKKDISTICIDRTTSIGEALKVMALNKPSITNVPAGIVLITDTKRKLQGIATSGDINRAIVDGVSLDEKIETIMNPKPFVVVGDLPAHEIVRLVVNKTREEGWHKDRLEKIVIVDRNHRVTDLVHLYDIWQGSDTRLRRIGVVGLGFVGLTLGLTLADLGFDVCGFDLNEKLKKQVRRKQTPFHEVGLEELLKQHVGKRFQVADSFKSHPCDVYFIAVGTPLGKNKKPNLAHLTSAAASVGKVLKYGDLVVLRSTVPIGTTRNVVLPLLEKESGLKAGDDFFLGFAPERTVEGKALEELKTLPQVIGGINRASSNMAADIFNMMTRTIHIVDTLEEAEVVKLINNTYRDVSFAFANEVALICQRWGIDTNKVISAANAGYARSSVPKPSPGVGGYCLDKDPYIFMQGGRDKNYEPALFRYAREVNDRILKSVADYIVDHLCVTCEKKKAPKILILGFAFKGKPATSDMRGSTSVALVGMLRKEGFKNIHGFDPVVPNTEIRSVRVQPVADMKAGFRGADCVIIMNNHSHFEELEIQKYLKLCSKGALFFDTWALHQPEEVAKVPGILYKRL